MNPLKMMIRLIRKTLQKLMHRPKPAAQPTPAPAVPDAPGFAMPALDPATAHAGTVWIPRVLWALEWAGREKLGPQTAAELARILNDQAKLKAAPNNVARAFRDLNGDPRARGLWSVDAQRYAITPDGRSLLRRLPAAPAHR